MRDTTILTTNDFRIYKDHNGVTYLRDFHLNEDRRLTNLELFLTVYKNHLAQCHSEDPQSYSWDLSELDEVFKRMQVAISHGTFNKDSGSFRRTCNSLRIKHTYKAINEFIRML